MVYCQCVDLQPLRNQLCAGLGEEEEEEEEASHWMSWLSTCRRQMLRGWRTTNKCLCLHDVCFFLLETFWIRDGGHVMDTCICFSAYNLFEGSFLPLNNPMCTTVPNKRIYASGGGGVNI